jgi:hypothetical protein
MQYTHQVTGSRQGSQIPDLLLSRGLICYVKKNRASKRGWRKRHCIRRVFRHTTVNYYNGCTNVMVPVTPSSHQNQRKCETDVPIRETGTDLPFPCYVVRTPLLVSIFHLSRSLPFLLCSFLIYIFLKVELYNRRRAPERKVVDTCSFIRMSCLLI